MKISERVYILLIVVVIVLSFRSAYAYLVSYQLHDRILVKYNVEPTGDLISPREAARVALMNVFALNIREVVVILDTYPSINISTPTYSFEIMMNFKARSLEGETASVKVDAKTGKILDISRGLICVDPA
ncbi:MAG TPA: hypothetical protein VMW22_09800 [Candidatus Desulfaltia sp.]|nr:hypothetical protein [Candidatus Desulfaltia sp.]